MQDPNWKTAKTERAGDMAQVVEQGPELKL
jgi:hypothetical protein